ncbi:MAG TPA: putative PEP-binding protein [Devosiaceae bacterium]
MFAVAPAQGEARLTAAQVRLLVGKALWIHLVAEANLPVVPTICLTRTAWEALQAERSGSQNRLRAHWVSTLFKLVGKGEDPPPLVVRTSAERHSAGLLRARTGIAAPTNDLESVDTARPLARAIKAAFDSYGETEPVWADASEQARRGRQIVIVQAMAGGELEQFMSRNTATGAFGPSPVHGASLPDLPKDCAQIARALDAEIGQHMACLVAIHGARALFVSARPVQVSAAAELEAAVERVESGVWTPRQAVGHINPARLPQLLHPRLSNSTERTPIATGLGVSPGAASGEVVFSGEDAARSKARGRHCILVAVETGPTDIEGMKAATGILTARGGMTSHAAVVARITGKPCVAGVRNLAINLEDMTCSIGERQLHAGDKITIDGTDGNIFDGALPLSRPHIGGAIGKLLDWADGSRTIAVRTNVETVEAATTALNFGAEGIGLARSEHMFFSASRMLALRRLILSESESDRARALKGLVDYQTGDYAELFATMRGKPVNVRLFDPPLHEFLPRSDEDIAETAAALGFTDRALRMRLDRLAEVNPMLGHRGCRLAITYPEVLDMQMHALIAGARAAAERQSEPLRLEVMVPFVSSAREVSWIRAKVMAIAEQAGLLADSRIVLSFGTMIELPRAALRAGDIAQSVDFFSFGTNDLTQTTYGISRDDAPAFLAAYQRKGLYDFDPFVTIDQRGVGELIRIAIERGKAKNPNLKIGICGEHAGEPESLKFFAGLDIDYVSCSPYRVPVARLALAQFQA